MRLTRQTNHAIRILMYCALRGEKLSRVGEIATAYSISELFLFKVLQPLVEAGFVETVRGRNGGIRLRKPADTITLRAVVEVAEENFSLAECFETGISDCPLAVGCSLNGVLHEALDAFFAVLASYTIADLVADKAGMSLLLGFDTPGRTLASARMSQLASAAVAFVGASEGRSSETPDNPDRLQGGRFVGGDCIAVATSWTVRRFLENGRYPTLSAGERHERN